MRLVIALGGNALLPRGQRLEFETQRRSAATAAMALAPVVNRHQVVLTHGNGPQVGLLALQAEAYHEVAGYPLDVLVAETEGMIGYILETELDRFLDTPIITILSRTVVSAGDPAFQNPTKPIGPVYEDSVELRKSAAERGWDLRPDGDAMRRVVASPDPIRIVQSGLIAKLVESGVLVICAGGGGIPVVEEDGYTRGVEAVVDKDLASSLLAVELGADMLVCLTDVDGVYEGWGGPNRRLIRRENTDWFRSRRFAAGSMRPKIEAACRFVEATGGNAAIGCLEEVDAVVEGESGTMIVPAKERIGIRPAPPPQVPFAPTGGLEGRRH